MTNISYRELKRRFSLDGAQKTANHLKEAIREGHLLPEDFSLRDLAETLIEDGDQWVRSLAPNSGRDILESEGVDSSAFSAVTAEIIYTRIMQAYNGEQFVASRLVDIIPSRLSSERIPGIGKIAGDVMQIAEGMPYPSVGMSPDYVDTPETAKYGLIVPVTREAIFYDQTGLILKRASEVGEALGVNREKRILDTILGISNTYTYNGAALNTYYASGGSWVNKLTGNELENWSDVDAAEQLFANMIDPHTGEPIIITPNSVLIMPAKRFTAASVFLGNQLTFTGGTTEVSIANPLTRYKVTDSTLAYRRLLNSGVSETAAKKYWYIGDFRKAFAYMENWPVTVTQSSRFSEASFTSDILIRFKASERGTPAVLDPRYVVCCTG